jgi:glyoxylase-like metal-dependent hydrolase (beta-lactamase superfamily II)
MKTEKVGARSVIFTFTLPEWDLNLHLITAEKRNYLIDTGLGSESVAPVLEYLGGSAKPLVVINTHHHWDHVWGNHCFGGSLMIAHSLCRQRIGSEWEEMLGRNRRFVRGTAGQGLPDLVFDDSLYFPEDHIRLFHTPGHSADCISVYDEEDKLLNAGDNIGDTLDEIVPELKSDIPAYRNTLRVYAGLDVNACVSGHNIVLGKDVFARIEAELYCLPG